MRSEMRHTINKMSFIVAFIFSLFLVPAPVIADEITIVADEWPPYCGKPDSIQVGYGIEIAKHVFASAGHTVNYIVTPWTRAIADTRAGKYNAIIGAYKEEAPDFVFPEEEFGIAKDAFYAKTASTWTYEGLESLRAIKIGAIKGYSYGEELDTYFKKKPQRVQYVYGDDPILQNIKKLLLGRVDVIIACENVLLHKSKEMGEPGKVINVGGTGVSGKLYIAFSPKILKSKEYADIFTKGLRKLKDSGELEKILARYGLTYWE